MFLLTNKTKLKNSIISKIRTLFCVLSFLICCFTIHAEHIVGGDMTYECLGNNSFRFYLKIYFECDGFLSSEESVIRIGVYRGNETNPFGGGSRIVNMKQVQELDLDINQDCVFLSENICVTEAQYEFDLELPPHPDGYHISYQRCCRNSNVINIQDPNTIGATYSIFVSNEAITNCSNSPKFNTFPPLVICANNLFEFDHSASLGDGDNLVYSFCSALVGGGNDSPISSPNGNKPDPPTPPPYAPVPFASGYSDLNPMEGLEINPVTGVITGVPTLKGRFAVGVCVKEYKDGILISEIKRDFQFNVTECDPLVAADVDEVDIQDGAFIVRSCSGTTVEFINQSYQEEFISEYLWTFDIDGTQQVSTDKNPIVTFPSVGEYTATLTINSGTDCGDIANIIVQVNEAVRADFEFDTNECQEGPIDFTFIGLGTIEQYLWDFGDGTTSNDMAPSHQFPNIGTYTVSLTVDNGNGCIETTSRDVTYAPSPTTINITASDTKICIPNPIFFKNEGTTVSDDFTLFWDFGDGTTSNELEPTHIYQMAGTYDIKFSLTTPAGCVINQTFPNINVSTSPEAGFSWTPERPNNLNTEVHFKDESSGAVGWFWDFDKNNNTTSIREPSFDFLESGDYNVIQVVSNDNGCTDTVTQLISVEPFVSYILPNAFTPNQDGINDVYIGTGYFTGIQNFQMIIWDRHGKQVFSSTDPNKAWNGRFNNEGRILPSGIYICTVSYTDGGGRKVNLKEFASLLK